MQGFHHTKFDNKMSFYFSECYLWIQHQETFANLKNAFDETSSFASLQRIEPNLEGNYLYVRFVASTGDAMGMNMV
jgi:hydroxymethylglutaryl-CoA reductase (NADPH)